MGVEYGWFQGDRRVEDQGRFAVQKAISVQCDICKHTGEEDDSETWKCACPCHDSWKFIQDGGRYRAQMRAIRRVGFRDSVAVLYADGFHTMRSVVP
jgi:hypothetical protein